MTKTQNRVAAGITIAVLVAAWIGFKLEIRRASTVQTTWPKSTPIPIPEIINPFETPEEREAKKGYIIVDQAGQPWGQVSRDDNGDVTKGLPIDLTNISTGDNEPIVTRESDGWHVRFKPAVIPTPTP